MSKKKKQPKGNWCVRIKVERIIEICCADCTEEQARHDPFAHQDGGDQLFIDQRNWDVIDVEPNE